MAVGPPSVEWLRLSDEELAYTWMAWILEGIAEKRGIPITAIGHAEAKALLLLAARQEVDDIRAMAMEKGISKTVAGDACGGGKVFRAFLLDGAQRAGLERREESRRTKLAANSRKAVAAILKYTPEDHAKWNSMAQAPELAKLRSKTDRARRIAYKINEGRAPQEKLKHRELEALIQAIRKTI